MKFHELCGNEHAKRAAEVALAGNHQIVFIGPPQGEAWAFALATNQAYHTVSDLRDTSLAYTWRPCPCGEAYANNWACVCDDSVVREWQQRYPMPAADIYVHVLRPDSKRLMQWARAGFADGELHEQIMARVKQARLNGLKGPFEFSDVAWTLLDAATRQLVLQPSHLRSIVAVAQTAARLASANQVEAQHIAEAIQYHLRGYEFRQPE